MAKEYEVLADNLLKACGYKVSEGNLEKLNNPKVTHTIRMNQVIVKRRKLNAKKS